MAVDCVPQTAGYLSVTTSGLEDYLFRGDHPVLKDMSWSTYGMWVYRVELAPGAETSIRAAVPRFLDMYFSPAYKLYNTHCQRIRTEPRVPMFEGFSMPTLTTDSERNAMYKQLQCRSFAVSASPTLGASAEDLPLPLLSLTASGGRLGASAICRAARVPLFVGDGGGTGYDAREAGACAGGGAQFSACCRETEPVCCMLDYSLRIFCLVCVVVLGNQDTAISSTVGGTTDPNWEGVQATVQGTCSASADEQQPRATVAMYASMQALERLVKKESLDRARQEKPKKRRDADQYLHSNFSWQRKACQSGVVKLSPQTHWESNHSLLNCLNTLRNPLNATKRTLRTALWLPARARLLTPTYTLIRRTRSLAHSFLHSLLFTSEYFTKR